MEQDVDQALSVVSFGFDKSDPCTCIRHVSNYIILLEFMFSLLLCMFLTFFRVHFVLGSVCGHGMQ